MSVSFTRSLNRLITDSIFSAGIALVSTSACTRERSRNEFAPPLIFVMEHLFGCSSPGAPLSTDGGGHSSEYQPDQSLHQPKSVRSKNQNGSSSRSFSCHVVIRGGCVSGSYAI